ncbi:fibronectin type III domain-containing protein [Kribbella sp. NPDC056345]|uniref:fibronectin type III domain-containing protein n=1 Tax=Kribbella sp. NPDC056345 TaxID=3345789 RepID=UPI0035E22B27
MLGLTNSTALTSSAELPRAQESAAAVESAPNAGAGRYVPLAAPVRMLDTQTGIGTPAVTAVPAQGTVPVKFTGRNGIPPTGVAAVQMNIVTGNTTAPGLMFAWPVGGTRPPVPNFYFYKTTGFTSSASIVRLNATGEAVFQNASEGTLRILAEVTGYYTSAESQVAGTRFVPLRQSRVIDTRKPLGVPAIAPVAAKTVLTVSIASKGGLPAAAGIASAALSITAWEAQAAGGWVASAGGAATPNAYFGNFAPGKPYTNTGIVKLSADGRLALYNSSTGTTHYTVDVVGYFVADTSSAAVSTRTVPVRSQRLLDSGSTLVAPNTVKTVQVGGLAGMPASGLAFAALQITASGAATAGEVVAYPANEARPAGVTDVSWPVSGNSSYNLVWVRVGPAGTVNIVNGTNAGLRLTADVQAYAVAPGLPQTPTNLAGGARDRAVEVRWDPPADTGDLPIAGYDVTTTPGSVTTSTATNSVVVSGLTNGTSYTFKIRARTAAGASAYSAASAPVVPAVPKPPGQPFITSTVARDSGARVSWVAPEGAPDQVASYEISTVPATTTVPAARDDRTADIYGLTNGETYAVVVTAKNANGSTASAGDRVTPAPADVAMKPASVEVYELDTRLDLQWVEPADGGSPVLDYEVVAEPGSQRLVIPADTTVAALAGLTNGTTYTVKVRARTKAGDGAWSERTATPVAARVPDVPTDLQVSPAATGTLKVAWKPPSDPGTSAVTGYRVTVSPGGRVVEATGSTAEIDGLAQETDYSVTVQAVNAAGVSTATAPSEPMRAVVEVKQAPIVLTADSLNRIASVGEEYISISSPNAQLTALKANDLVLATPSRTTPRGLLRKVVRVEGTASRLVLQTENAALDQVLARGALNRSLTFDSAEAEAIDTELPGVTLKRPTIGGRSLQEGAQSAVQTAGGKKLRVSLKGSKVVIGLDGDLNKALNLEGTAEADLRSDLSFAFRSDGIFTHFRPTVDTKVDIKLKIAYTEQFQRRIELGTIPGPVVVVPIGATPVTIHTGIVVDLEWDSEGRAGLDIHTEFGRRIGADITFSPTTPVPAVQPIQEPLGPFERSVRVFGSSENTVSIGAKVYLKIYDVLGPDLVARPYVKLDADTEEDPWIKLFVGIQFGAGVRLDFLKKNLLEWHKEDLVHFEYQFNDIGGRFTGLEIDPGGAAVAVGEQLKFTPRIWNYPDAPATWSAEGGGQIAPDGTFTGVKEGPAKVKATVPAGVGRPELTAEVPVVVGPHGPSQPTNLTAVPGNLSAYVSWQPPARPGGRPIDKYVVTTEPDTGAHTVSGTTRNLTISGLQAGTSYRASVYAVSSEDRGDAATSDAFVARPSVLESPLANDLMRGLDGSSNTIGPELSDDGRYAFFPLSVQPEEVPPPGIPNDGNFYLVRRDLESGLVELASVQADGATPQSISAPLSESSSGYRPSTQREVSSTADGRFVAYVVDDGGPRRRVMIHDFVQHTVWSATTGVAEDIVKIWLTGGGSVVAAMTEVNAGTSSYGSKVFRMAKGGAAKRVDMCTADTVCDGAVLIGTSADGNTVIYSFYTSNNASPYYNRDNKHVFYNTASGASEMPYYNTGSTSYKAFWDLTLSRNGLYFTAQAWIGSFDNPEDVFVTKRIGTGPVTDADIFQGGYSFAAPGETLGISDDGRSVAWRPGCPHTGGCGTTFTNQAFLTKNLTTGATTAVWNLPLVQAYGGLSGMSMAADGSMVAWMPLGPVNQAFPLRPTGRKLG